MDPQVLVADQIHNSPIETKVKYLDELGGMVFFLETSWAWTVQVTATDPSEMFPIILVLIGQ